MNASFCIACILLAQTPGEIQFRPLQESKVEVVASLTEAQVKVIPLGKVNAEQGEAWLRLGVVDPQTNKPGPPMLGSYERDATHLIFRPRFGMEPGRTYRATFGPLDGPVVTKDYRRTESNDAATATVTKIYPSADILPANHLKFHIYFSQPMRGGQEIFDQIEILDAEGNPIPDAWLPDELWDASGRILILYIHPGRIKWGVVLRDLLGPVLIPNRQYTLVIRGTMLAANGQKLGKDVTKKFRTSTEDRQRIPLNEWTIQAPKSGTSAAVTVRFPQCLDHASLGRFLTVLNAQGTPVAGTATPGPDEKSWTFTPKALWENEEYRVAVNGRLEDIAGNTPLRPFDLDLQAPAQLPQALTIPFRPGMGR